MTVTVELPDPAELWHRWVTIAAALTTIGFDDTWSLPDGGGAHHDDGGGNWAHLDLVEGGRAVLYGYDHEYSATAHATPPLDLLAGAPPWLPWTVLLDHAGDDQLGYVLWHEDGRWHRVAYPDGLDDGLQPTAGPVLDARATLAELASFVFEWGEHDVDTPHEREQVASAAARLLAGTGPDELRDLFGRLTGPVVDPRRGLAVAARGGLTGDPVPVLNAGTRPGRRTVRKLSDTEHDQLVWAAMRRADERARPAPVTTGELGALVTWLRSRAPGADGRCSLLVYADENSLAAHHGDHPPREKPGEGSFGIFRELSDLVRRLRAAEADDTYGRWLFLHVETTSGGFTIERRYDSWPPWWAATGGMGPWRGNLRAEIDARGPQWRPDWTALLSPEVAYRPAD
ncbi:hypothetical protein [Actinoplanes sp. NPDC051494]|uniref:hypothetical protein n=1 Tax=Actinoplanes sp. NPDC051494 TaxID=3363907 RepID=UPI0037873660